MCQKLYKIVTKLYNHNRINKVININMDRKESVRKEAADWLTSMHGEGWNRALQDQFDLWINQSSQHAEIFQDMQHIWTSIPSAVASVEFKTANIPKPSAFSTFWQPLKIFSLQWKMAALAFCCVISVGIFIGQFQNSDKRQWQSYETAIGENKSITLKDGSHLVLGAASSIRWQLGDHQRLLTLLTGQVFFDIAKDSDRPFIIQAGLSSIEVVGTQFDIRKIQNKTEVSVLEGHVKVYQMSYQNGASDEPTDAQSKVSLFAGDKLKIRYGVMEGNLEKISLNEISAWQNGRFVYRNADLADVISDAKRYYQGDINLHGKGLESLKVTTTFTLEQIDSMGYALEKILPIRVIRDKQDNLLIVNDT